MTLRIKHLYIVLLVFALVFNACKKKTKLPTLAEGFDEELVPERIKSVLSNLSKDTIFSHFFDSIRPIYSKNDYAPLWISKLKQPSFLKTIKLITDSIAYEGLKQEHYYVDSVLKYTSIIANSDSNKITSTIYDDCAKADLYISNLLVGLWHDKVLGRTNPKEVLGQKYTLPYPNHPGFDLLSVINDDSGLYKLQYYYPKHPDYWKLKQLLYDAYSITEGKETFIDTVGIRKLKPGDTTTIVPLLAERMVELGYAPDSILPDFEGAIVYTRRLAKYVIEFQKNSNVTDDGIIGKATLKLLNASRNDKIDEIRANIERSRWLGVEPIKPYVRVNIPEFMLYMYYPDSVKTLVVCVGKGKERYYDLKSKKYVVSKNYLDKPMNHETPQVYSNIDYVILNPTWTVPSSIVGREMYNLIVRNPNYLTKNGYEVFKNGEKVDPTSINWRKYSPGNIPYTIRQNAGDDNSLGKIKFTFKNPFDVYLHDTPLKSKFKLNNRAVSHGCVRVQSPVDLTGFVLQQNTKTTYDDVLIMMGLPPTDTARARKWSEDTTSYKKIVKKTYPIRLENKMTVFFDYRTIIFDDMGNARYLFDVYDKNRAIIDALNSRKRN